MAAIDEGQHTVAEGFEAAVGVDDDARLFAQAQPPALGVAQDGVGDARQSAALAHVLVEQKRHRRLKSKARLHINPPGQQRPVFEWISDLEIVRTPARRALGLFYMHCETRFCALFVEYGGCWSRWTIHQTSSLV